MTILPMEVLNMFGETIMKVVPITLVVAVVFTVLTHFWACNPGKHWWRKTEIVTDVVYWFFVPVITRVVRIGLLVVGAAVVFNIHDADELIAFYDNGHGPLAQMPLWVQGMLLPRGVRLHAVLAAPGLREGCLWRLCVVADVNVKQPLLFRHASSPPLFAARGRRRRLHSRPLVRGRAERRVPVAPLGLMRMRSSAIVSASGLSEAPSECPTFRLRCFFGCLHICHGERSHHQN
jgi:hypothetical protein